MRKAYWTKDHADDYLRLLKQSLTYDEANKEALERMVKEYYKTQQWEKANTLLKQCCWVGGCETIQTRKVPRAPSEASGGQHRSQAK